MSHFQAQESVQPKAGDQLYVPARSSDMSPEFDCTGGIATVKSVKIQRSEGKLVPFVVFEELPGITINFYWLLEQQHRLKALYQGAVAVHMPEYERYEDGSPHW